MIQIDVIPAIDLIGGKCVRLTKGDYSTQKSYHDNPVDMARYFQDLGAQYLHVVDLDGAKIGKVQQLSVLEKIASNTELKIDFGGGIKTTEDAEAVLNAGAKQFTAGSIAVKNKDLVIEWLIRFGSEKVIIGADVSNGNIAINGWQEEASEEILSFLNFYSKYSMKRIICTDVAKDGMLAGPSFDLYKTIQHSFPQIELVASGGISNALDILELDKQGIPAVIVGKAIYEEKISEHELSNLFTKQLKIC
jgi:phosphoribosylformimino-5-aminoimidazole carboxamide ribotide isomerase